MFPIRLTLFFLSILSLLVTSCGIASAVLPVESGAHREDLIEVIQPESTVSFKEGQPTSFTYLLPDGIHSVTLNRDEKIFSGVSALISQSLQDEHAPGFNRPEMFCLELQGFTSSGTLRTPQICILPAEIYAAMNPNAVIQIAELKSLLVQQPDFIQSSLPLPYLPLQNAVQMMKSQPAFLNFRNAAGVRYLTAHVQSPVPVTNTTLAYTFQGLTKDGSFIISALLPVSHPDLEPHKVFSQSGQDSEGYQMPIELYAEYGRNLESQLNAYDPTEFIPTLFALDALVQQISIQKPGSTIDDTTEASDAAQRSIQTLAELLNVDAIAVTIVSVEAVDWPDACLGIPEPEGVCAQALKPGYKILLETLGNQYEVHCNQDGTQIRMVSSEGWIGPEKNPAQGADKVDITIDGSVWSFEIPADWTRIGSDWLWMQEGYNERVIGVAWKFIQPPAEPEASMLPENAVMLDRYPLALDWTMIDVHKLEMFSYPAGQDPETLNFQLHALITTSYEEGKFIIDFYAEAETPQEMAQLESILQNMLHSLQSTGSPAA